MELKTYFENGETKSISEYINGLLDGLTVRYYENGGWQEAAIFEFGICTYSKSYGENENNKEAFYIDENRYDYKILKSFREKFSAQPAPSETGKTAENFEKTENEFGIVFPKAYIEFLSNNEEKEGTFGENHVSFWHCKDILQLNKEYQIHKYLPKEIIAFATDGGDNCFTFDYRNPTAPKIIEIHLGDLDINEIKQITDTFEQFITPAPSETGETAEKLYPQIKELIEKHTEYCDENGDEDNIEYKNWKQN